MRGTSGHSSPARSAAAAGTALVDDLRGNLPRATAGLRAERVETGTILARLVGGIAEPASYGDVWRLV